MSAGTVLALDMANDTGFAYRTPNGLELGVLTLPAGPMRWFTFRDWIKNLHAEQKIVGIAYEQVMNRGMQPGQVRTAHVYGGLLAIVEMFAYPNSIPVQPLAIAAIKKHATGNGTADKERMVDAALKALIRVERVPQIGASFDHNAADAYWILRLAEHQRRAGYGC